MSFLRLKMMIFLNWCKYFRTSFRSIFKALKKKIEPRKNLEKEDKKRVCLANIMPSIKDTVMIKIEWSEIFFISFLKNILYVF